MGVIRRKEFSRFYLIYLVIVIAFFDNFSLLPLTSPYATSLGASLLLASIIVAAYSFSNMIGNLFFGYTMDKIGKVNCIFWGLIIGSVGVFSYSLALNPEQLLVARIIHGLGMAIVVPATFAYIGSYSSEDNRGSNMAKSGIAIAIAALLGPSIGGIIKATLAIEYMFYLITIILLLGAVITKLMFKETEVFESNDEKSKNSTSKLMEVMVKPKLVIAYLAAFFLMMGKGTLATTLPLYVEGLGYSAAVSGMLFSSFALASIMIFVALSRLSDNKGRYLPLVMGLLLISSSLGLMGFAKSLSLLVPLMFVYGIGFGFVFPASTALVIDLTEKEERGYAFGVFYAVFSLGVVIGPILTAFLAAWIFPLLSASLILFLGVGIILMISAHQTRHI